MKKKKKLIMLITGALMISVGTVLCKKTSLGIDPFNAFCVGLSERLYLGLGATTLLVNSVLFLAVLMMSRSLIGIGTIFTMVSLGYLISFFNAIIPSANFEVFSIQNILLFIVGMLVFCFGIALYIESQLGMVPYDCLPFLFVNLFGGKTFAYRVGLDSFTSFLAFILGGPINIGTIVLAAGLGPLIDFFRRFVTRYVGFKKG